MSFLKSKVFWKFRIEVILALGWKYGRMFHWLKVDWLPFSYKYYIFYLVTLHYFIEASCKDTHENQKISVTWYATQIVLKITFQKLAFVAVKECNSIWFLPICMAAPFFFFLLRLKLMHYFVGNLLPLEYENLFTGDDQYFRLRGVE